MPELPEVETIARKLQPVVVGKTIHKVNQLHAKPWRGEVAAVEGQKILDVSRRAKILRLHLANHHSILVHLKMTGQLIYTDPNLRLGGGHPTADWIHQLPAKHTRVWFELEPESQLYFNDQRLFGWLKVVADADLPKEYAGLGPDINDPTLTAEYLAAKLARKRIPIKVALLDNAIVCGLGNIYVCDALNLAQIDPHRPAGSLSAEEVARAFEAAQVVIKAGIEMGGTTFDGKYVDVAGFAGQYQSVVRVYDRLGQPCLNCSTPIEKFKLAGRGTYWCPSCQK